MQDSARRCSRCGTSYPAEAVFCPADGAPLGGRRHVALEDPYLGRTVGGQLQLEQLIGVGAMGRVYRAHQAPLKRQVAVKLLHRELLKTPSLVARFLREGHVAARLTHPNVTQVLMAGVVDAQAPGEEAVPYLAMEYLDGLSLRSVLAATGALPLARTLRIALQLCDALGEAHALGIIHRDLKPENVLLLRRGHDPDFVKLLDFGAASLEQADDGITTQAGAILGTARYVSPEGARGHAVSPASDVYSLAAVLFECLSGQPPFHGEGPLALLLQHIGEPAPKLGSLPRAAYVPAPIAALVDRNLAKLPEERHPNAKALGRALVEATRAAGLCPEGFLLHPRSFGEPTGPLALPSLERTHRFILSPAFAARLEGETAPRGGDPSAPREAPHPRTEPPCR